MLGLDETIKAEEETRVSPIVGKELLRPRPRIFPTIDCIMIVLIACYRVLEKIVSSSKQNGAANTHTTNREKVQQTDILIPMLRDSQWNESQK